MWLGVLLISVLVLVALAGIFLTVLQLPGTWLVVAGAALYDWYYAWQRIGWKWLAAFAALALAAEVIDLAASAVAAHKAGASRRASFGALAGGMLGMIIFSVPLPVIGTVIGGLIGCFLGATIAELTVRDDLAAVTRVGLFAALGRVIGLVAKIGASLAIAGAAVCRAILSLQ